MGRILDARGDEAIDVLTALLEPFGEIASDKALINMMRTGGGGSMTGFTKALLTDHREAVIEIFAIDDGKTVQEERNTISVVLLPIRLLQLLSAPAVRELLFGLKTTEPATGSSAESGSGNG